MVSNCPEEFCMLCEMGFLMRMLEDSKGLNCQASNFLRAFSTLPQVEALGLLEPSQPAPTMPYNQIIQNFLRFLLEKFNQECQFTPQMRIAALPWINDKWSMVQQLFGMQVISVSKCQCQYETKREQRPFCLDIVYPKKIASPAKASSETPTFVELLNFTFSKSNETKAWCEKCQNYTPTTQFKRLRNLPPFIYLNCGVWGDEEAKIWRNRESGFRFEDVSTDAKKRKYIGFLNERIRITVGEKEAKVSELKQDEGIEELPNSSNEERNAVYQLTGLVCQIETGTDPNHLVSFIRTSVKEEGTDEYRWYLFNDFLVREVTLAEALQFKARWKVPAILQYSRVDVSEIVKADGLKQDFDRQVITEVDDSFYEGMYRYSSTQSLVEPLAWEELGDHKLLVALDAEFVALSREEVEVHSDGTRSLIRPIRMHLARVSVVRGEGQLEGIPFIDDYISTSEPIVDYLTEYSGIQPEDLDPTRSRHTVIPLKSAYKKLRVLVDMGCIFIGHGLKKDFRTINILVPPNQIVDTVDIYRLEGQRKISLRYLAWYVLGRDIQMDSHDSIEDARVALHLYKKYRSLEKEGKFTEYLEQLYNEGRKLNWKPPHWRRDVQDTVPGEWMSPFTSNAFPPLHQNSHSNPMATMMPHVNFRPATVTASSFGSPFGGGMMQANPPAPVNSLPQQYWGTSHGASVPSTSNPNTAAYVDQHWPGLSEASRKKK